MEVSSGVPVRSERSAVGCGKQRGSAVSSPFCFSLQEAVSATGPWCCADRIELQPFWGARPLLPTTGRSRPTQGRGAVVSWVSLCDPAPPPPASPGRLPPACGLGPAARPAGPGRPRVAGAGSAGSPESVPLAQKQPPPPPPPPDFTDPLAPKKPRISHFAQRVQPAANGQLSAPQGREALLPTPGPLGALDTPLPPRLDPPRTHDPLADVSNDLGHSGRDGRDADRERRDLTAPAPTAHPGLPLPPDCAAPSRPHGPRSKAKKKSKKHKDKDKERAAEDRPQAQAPEAPGGCAAWEAWGAPLLPSHWALLRPPLCASNRHVGATELWRPGSETYG